MSLPPEAQHHNMEHIRAWIKDPHQSSASLADFIEDAEAFGLLAAGDATTLLSELGDHDES